MILLNEDIKRTATIDKFIYEIPVISIIYYTSLPDLDLLNLTDEIQNKLSTCLINEVSKVVRYIKQSVSYRWYEDPKYHIK